MRGHGKRQAHVHTAGVAFDRCVNEFLNAREIHDLIQLAAHFILRHAQNRPIEIDVFPPGQVRVEASTHLQQAGDAAFNLNEPAGGGGDLRQDLEQSAFSSPIAPNNTQRLP